MKKILLLAVSILATLTGDCQTVDSIARGKDLNRAALLYKLSYATINTDSRQALEYSLEGYHIFLRHKDSLSIVRMGLLCASALRRLQKFDSSVVVYNTIYAIAKRSNYVDELAYASNGLGVSYTFLAQYDKALQHYFESWEIRKAYGDKIEEIRLMINIGIVYYKLKNYEQALDLFLKCHEMEKDTGHFIDTDLLMINIGQAYVYLANYAKALEYLEKGLDTCGQNCSEVRLMEAAFGKGVAYFGLGDMAQAERFFLKSHKLSKGLNNARFQLDNIDYLSRVYLRNGLPQVAATYLTAGEALIRNYPSLNLEKIKLYSRLSDLYRSLKKYKRASDYQLIYIQLRDSVYSEELTKNLIRIESEYQEKENIAKIAAQREIIALNNRIIDRQKQVNTLLILVAVVSAGLILMIYKDYRKKKKANAFLDLKIEERTHELVLNGEYLARCLTERDLVLARTIKSHTEYFNAIQCLCVTGLKEVSDSLGRTYMLRIEGVANDAKRLSDARSLPITMQPESK